MPNGHALSCKGIKVFGDVRIGNGFAACGNVVFWGAEIGKDLLCLGGTFIAPRNPPATHIYVYALDLGGAKIGGTFWLGIPPSKNKEFTNAFIYGLLNLKDAYAERFRNHPDSWPRLAKGDREAGAIELHGFVYERLGGDSPTDACTCKKWFRPQPFEQLIKVLREMGHDADARQVAMFKQSQLRPIRRKQTRWYYYPFVGFRDLAWGITCGYGYRPHRLAVALFFLWLICGGLYFVGAANGGFAPRDAQVWTNADYAAACGESWTTCIEVKTDKISELLALNPSTYSACDTNWTACGGVRGGKVNEIIPFYPFLYSADLLLPAIDLGQRSAWTPMRREVLVTLPHVGETTLPKWMLLYVTWAENMLGVTGVILIGAILSGFVKRD